MSKQQNTTQVEVPAKLPPLIKEVKQLKDDKKQQLLQLEVHLNPQIQRLVYEQLYKQHAKDAEMKGFRKGNVPREILEPQIYQQLVQELISTLVIGLPAELSKQLPEILGEERVVIGDPLIEDLKFKMVETPIVIKMRLYWAPKPTLPSLDQFKLKEIPEVTVDDKEVEETVKALFEDWKKRVDKRTASEFEKPNDEWVKKLGIKGIESLKDLRAHLRERLIQQKKLHTLNHLFEETFHKLLHAFEVKIPEAYVNEQLEHTKAQIQQQMQQLGVSYEDYLKANNISEEDLKKQVQHQTEDAVKQRIFWNLYIKERNIQVDAKQDRLYLERAAYEYAAAGKAQVTSLELLTRALLIKAQEQLLKELGFIEDDEEKGKEPSEIKQTETEDTPKNDAKPKILIPDDAKI